jgi:hypothetical protein
MREVRKLIRTLAAGVGVSLIAAGTFAGQAVASQPDSAWSARYEAEDAAEFRGAVHLSKDIGDQPAEMTSPLEGYSGGGFVDFADPVPSTAWQGTIPAGTVGARYVIEVPRTGNYRLKFVYNNPGTKWAGSRNVRDERNMRINVNGNDYLGQDGWVGWMIFSVSGYNAASEPGATQTPATVGQNTAWNTNYMNVPLREGENQLRMSIEAPPGQGVYDGPNLDYVEVEWIDDRYVAPEDVPVKRDAFVHPGIYQTNENLTALKTAIGWQGSVWADGYAQLAASPLASFDYSRPDGYYEVVERGPYNNPNRGATQFTNDATAVHYNALQWYLTGDIRHARKAIELLNGWSATLKSVVNNDARLLVAMSGRHFVSGAELLKHVYNADPTVHAQDRWQADDMERFDSLVRSVFYEGTLADYYPQANGNWDALITGANMAFGVYLDDHELFNAALMQFHRGDVIPGTASMGSLANYIYATGESQESNRDVGHWGMGLEGLGYSSEISLNQGLDIFDAYDARLLSGANYFGLYNLTSIGLPVVSETFVSDRGRGNVSTPVFEILESYYAKRSASQDLTTVRRVLNEKFRAGTRLIDTLLFQDAPFDEGRPVVLLESPATHGTFGTAHVRVRATDDRGLKRVVAEIYKNGTLVSSTETPADGAVSATHEAELTLPGGQYILKYRAEDIAGNVSRVGTSAFKIDATESQVLDSRSE